jgi:LPS export ABC transporter protein LptC
MRARPEHSSVSLRLRSAACAALLTSVLAACKDTETPTLATGATLADSAQQVMYGLRTNLTSAGVRRARLLADTAFFYDDGNRIELRVVRMTAYTANGDSDAVMIGKRATYDVRQQKLDGRGDVVLTTVAGRKLTSPHLVYDQVINQVSSDTNFTFVEPGRTVSGVGFRSDPGLRNLEILSGFKGRVRPGAPTLPPPGRRR